VCPDAASVTAISRRGDAPVAPNVDALALDIRDYPALDGAIEKLRSAHVIDVVVNCVGVGFFAPIGANHSEAWTDILTTNVVGVLNLVSVIDRQAPDLGTFVQIGSMAAHRPSVTPGNECYTASKVAAKSIVEQYRAQVRARGGATRVVMVSPGYVQGTDFEANFFSKSQPPAPTDIFAGQATLAPVDVARVVADVVATPRHIEIADILVLPVLSLSAEGRGRE
jgi:NADP-dependent 3-hydroxy acid dehydrogenase YdfG